MIGWFFAAWFLAAALIAPLVGAFIRYCMRDEVDA